jgi:hypothetical protein
MKTGSPIFPGTWNKFNDRLKSTTLARNTSDPAILRWTDDHKVKVGLHRAGQAGSERLAESFHQSLAR